jgi:hypothetical protein
VSTTEKAIYRDPGQPLEARVDDLLARMTLEEKAAQMVTFSVGGVGRLLTVRPDPPDLASTIAGILALHRMNDLDEEANPCTKRSSRS